jgi:hypothetical protein
MKIYIVYGQTGEYEDAREWSIVAYVDKQRAIQHAWDAQERANQFKPRGYSEDPGEFNAHMGDLDTIGSWDGDVEYAWYELGLIE